MRKRRFRRYRPLKRRRIFRRRRRFSRVLAYKRNSPEIKTHTLLLENRAINEIYEATANASLLSGYNISTNWLSSLAQGSDFNNRVGNRIYAMKAVIDVVGTACPASGTTVTTDNALVRFIVHNSPSAYNTDISYFFGYNKHQAFNVHPNRKMLNIYHDSYLKIGWNSNTANASLTDANSAGGFVFRKRIVIPLNRQIEFTPQGTVKNDRDNFGLAMLALTPWVMKQTATIHRQVACTQITVRFYFKDT